MEKQFNKNISNLKQSDIRSMSLKCNNHSNGINLSQGICDLDIPDELINGVNLAVKQGYNIYTRYDGIDELRQSVSYKMKNYNNVNYSSEKEIVITCGSTGGFYLTLLTLFNAEDEIIIFQPFYGYHYNTIITLGLKPVVLNMNPVNDKWEIDITKITESITDKTKAILINTPSNPSGKVFTEKEIESIGQIVKKHNLYLITDEIYEYITFDGMKHFSPASIDSLKEHTITIGGFSKTFSITGWRIGYLCATEEITAKIGILNDLVYICAPAPLQKAVSAGLKINKSFFDNLSKFYLKNRNLLTETLLNIGFKVFIPEGAYYMLADFTNLNYSDCYEAADKILEKTGVASVPGSSFFCDETGSKLLRFCFAKKFEILQEACKNLYKLKV